MIEVSESLNLERMERTVTFSTESAYKLSRIANLLNQYNSKENKKVIFKIGSEKELYMKVIFAADYNLSHLYKTINNLNKKLDENYSKMSYQKGVFDKFDPMTQTSLYSLFFDQERSFNTASHIHKAKISLKDEKLKLVITFNSNADLKNIQKFLPSHNKYEISFEEKIVVKNNKVIFYLSDIKNTSYNLKRQENLDLLKESVKKLTVSRTENDKQLITKMQDCLDFLKF